MPPIETYVFLDLETTGLPAVELCKTKITEISLIAVKRCHLLETVSGASPRVQQKLTLCLNPGRFVDPESTAVTGLCNVQLEHEPPFNRNVVDTINRFLGLLSKPVCLIAQNGRSFDFPILKKVLNDIGDSFPEDILCADSLYAFHDILEEYKPATTSLKQLKSDQEVSMRTDELDNIILNNPSAFCTIKQEETTPKKLDCSKASDPKPVRKLNLINNYKNETSKARRRLFWNEGPKPKKSYKLQCVYQRLLKEKPVEAHRAENDCIMALKCSVVISKQFVHWVDENHIPFAAIKPMRIGVPLGD